VGDVPQAIIKKEKVQVLGLAERAFPEIVLMARTEAEERASLNSCEVWEGREKIEFV
jgi:hypothetical protein